MKIDHLIRIVAELLLSFFIKRVVQVNVPITGDIKVDNIIYGVISYGLILISIANFIQVIVAHRKGKDKKTFHFLTKIGIYTSMILLTTVLWYLINLWYFWIVFAIIVALYLTYYIKNREYKKEIRLYKKSILKALRVEYDFKIDKIKISKYSENFLDIYTPKDIYYGVVIANEDILRQESELNTLDSKFSILQTPLEDKYILLRYLTIIVIENKDELIPLYTYLTSNN